MSYERTSECLSMWNMLSCAEQVQIQKYKTHAYKMLKTTGVETVMLKNPTKQWKTTQKKITHETQMLYQRTHK